MTPPADDEADGDNEATARRPGRPNRFADAPAERRAPESVSGACVERLLAVVALLRHVPADWDLRRAVYRTFTSDCRSARSDADRRSVAERYREQLETDMHLWARGLAATFDTDDEALEVVARVPCDVLLFCFITRTWDRYNGSGGSTRAGAVIRKPSRITKKRSEWTGKLASHPSAAKFLALPALILPAILTERAHGATRLPKESRLVAVAAGMFVAVIQPPSVSDRTTLTGPNSSTALAVRSQPSALPGTPHAEPLEKRPPSQAPEHPIDMPLRPSGTLSLDTMRSPEVHDIASRPARARMPSPVTDPVLTITTSVVGGSKTANEFTALVVDYDSKTRYEVPGSTDPTALPMEPGFFNVGARFTPDTCSRDTQRPCYEVDFEGDCFGVATTGSHHACTVRYHQ